MNVDAIYAMIFVLLGSTCLLLLYRHHHRHVLVSRQQVFDDCHEVVQMTSSTLDGQGYASVFADWNNARVKLSVEVDNLTARKLPVMWMHITLYRTHKDSSGATLDILVRPQNTESFSPSWQWIKPVMPLAGWPQHARYMTKTQPPPLAGIDQDIKDLFADSRCKELLITPMAIRLTCLAKQSDRGHYLLLRAINFDDKPIEASLVADLLHKLDNLVTHLDEVQDEAA
ncbi:MAG: hypothetical protein VX829_04500 [Pseudomonadota bacterium]|nr:hypothetical protein [Pseudomonadota bacterium]